MTYDAEIGAGIDISKINVNVTDDEIILTVQSPTIRKIHINSESIKFYDEKYALFNWSNKQDVVEAITAAENDVIVNAEIPELLFTARETCEELLRELIEEMADGRKIVFKYKRT